MSVEPTERTSLRVVARITGGLYVLYMAASVLANVWGSIGLGSPRQVYGAITTDPSSFRLGLLVAFVSALLFLLTAWGLYVLLRTVNPELALLFLLLNTVGVAIQCASMLPLLAALHVTDPSSVGPDGLTTHQVQAIADLSITVYKTGFVTAQLFFGAWLFPLGYLVYKSGFLPRLLGVLLLLDGVAEVVWLSQALLLPTHPAIRAPGTAVSLLAEVGLALWLLVKGVRYASPATGLKDVEAATDVNSS